MPGCVEMLHVVIQGVVYDLESILLGASVAIDNSLCPETKHRKFLSGCSVWPFFLDADNSEHVLMEKL